MAQSLIAVPNSTSPCIFSQPPALLRLPDQYTTDSAVYVQPMAYCRKHETSGYLKLQDIEDDDRYVRVEVTRPLSNITHFFDDCVLIFPSSDSLVASVVEYSKVIRGPAARAITSSGSHLRRCLDCDTPVSGTGGEDSQFYRYNVFCSNKCCYYRTLVEELERDVAMTTWPEVGPGISQG